MSKAVMISIQPKWCEKIANSIKTIEIRKTRPKLEPPFKCYIYCTKNYDMLWILNKKERYHHAPKIADIFKAEDVCGATKANGKVIGEFVCDYITEITHGVDGDETPYIDTGYVGCLDCLTYEEMETYLQGKTGYGWHISDLVIYDKPKELSEFYKDCQHYDDCHNNKCPLYEEPIGEYNEVWHDCEGKKPITRPPQNWCYVEEHIPEKRHFNTDDMDNIFE